MQAAADDWASFHLSRSYACLTFASSVSVQLCSCAGGQSSSTYVPGPNRCTRSAQSKPTPLAPAGRPPGQNLPRLVLACARRQGQIHPNPSITSPTKPEQARSSPSKPTLTPRHRRNATLESPAYIFPGLVSSSRARPAPAQNPSAAEYSIPSSPGGLNQFNTLCACVGRVRGSQDISRARAPLVTEEGRETEREARPVSPPITHTQTRARSAAGRKTADSPQQAGRQAEAGARSGRAPAIHRRTCERAQRRGGSSRGAHMPRRRAGTPLVQ